MEKRQRLTENWYEEQLFVVSVHGTNIKMSSARFTLEYLRAVNSRVMPSQMLRF